MSTDHVVIKYDVQPPVMLCERCGCEQALGLPCPLPELCARGEAFAAAHADCEVRS